MIMRMRSGSWSRSGCVQQIARLELAPQRGRDLYAQHAQILSELFRAARARNDAGNARMEQWELQRSRLQRHRVARADRFHLRHLTEDSRRRGCVVEPCVLDGAARKNAGVVRAAQNDADIAPLAQ